MWLSELNEKTLSILVIQQLLLLLLVLVAAQTIFIEIVKKSRHFCGNPCKTGSTNNTKTGKLTILIHIHTYERYKFKKFIEQLIKTEFLPHRHPTRMKFVFVLFCFVDAVPDVSICQLSLVIGLQTDSKFRIENQSLHYLKLYIKGNKNNKTSSSTNALTVTPQVIQERKLKKMLFSFCIGFLRSALIIICFLFAW